MQSLQSCKAILPAKLCQRNSETKPQHAGAGVFCIGQLPTFLEEDSDTENKASRVPEQTVASCAAISDEQYRGAKEFTGVLFVCEIELFCQADNAQRKGILRCRFAQAFKSA